MTICYLSSSELPSRQANAVHVINMCQSLSELGYEVTLFGRLGSGTPTAQGNEEIFDYYGVRGGFRLVLLSFRKKGSWSKFVYALTIAFRSRRLEPNLVLSRNLPGSATAILLGLRVIHEFHAPPQNLVEHALASFLTQSKNLRGVVYITHALKTDMEALLGPLRPEAIVLPDGASFSRDETRNLKKNLLGQLKIGYAGSFYSGRGIEIILDLAERHPLHRFMLVGDNTNLGHESSLGERSLPENVEVLGFIPPKGVRSQLESCDILLAPYQEETVDAGGRNTTRWMSPLKIFEYMAAGRPIIASDLSALREVLVDEVNCLLVRAGDIQAWATAIHILEESKAIRERLASRAREDFEKNYSWDRRALRLTEWYSNSS